MSSDNPYSPPQTNTNDLPTAPHPYGWSIHHRIVTVQSSSRLPMIDPFSGLSADSMILHRMQVRHSPYWLWFLPLIGALVLYAPRSTSLSTTSALGLLPIGALLGWIASMIFSLFRPSCMLHVFLEKQRSRAHRIRSFAMNALFLTWFLSSFISKLMPTFLLWIPKTALICWLISISINLIFKRHLRCRHMDGKQFVIKGFHPNALDALEKWPT